MDNNQLTVDIQDFKNAIKVFRPEIGRKNSRVKQESSKAMLSFNDGFLIIETNGTHAVMRALGEWHGKAQFSFNTVKALVLVPPNVNPVIVRYLDGRLTLANMTVTCEWANVSKGMLDAITAPNLVDVIAMWRTQPSDELVAKGINKKIVAIQAKLEKAATSAAKKLADFDVTQQDLLDLVEAKVKKRTNGERYS